MAPTELLVNYLALVAWHERADCVVVEAPSLRRFFGVERLSDQRVQSLVRVAKPLFPVSKKLWSNPESNANVALYLSRLPLPGPVFRDVMTTASRVDLLNLVVPTVRVAIPERQKLVKAMRSVGEGSSVFSGRTNATPGARSND
jgi:hypothetical protein